MHIEEKLQDYEAEFRETGEVSLEKEYSQVYGLVITLFDRITALLGDEAVGKKNIQTFWTPALREIKVGLIPAVVDRVVVGDIHENQAVPHQGAVFLRESMTGLFRLRQEEAESLPKQSAGA